MEKLTGAAIYLQSGGPTAVINNGFLGVYERAKKSKCITKLYCARNGLIGLINGDLFDMDNEDPAEIKLLKNTPSSVFGSARYQLIQRVNRDIYPELAKILAVVKKYNIRYIFVNGGNSTMASCKNIEAYLHEHGHECRVIGMAKTIDNDLEGTDYCAGYGSAAKFIATSCMEIRKDVSSYPSGTICVVEMMGRNTGWLTAAAALSNSVDYIYVPEVSFNLEKFLNDIGGIVNQKKNVIVAVSEGIIDEKGGHIGASKSVQVLNIAPDQLAQLGGVSVILSGAVSERFPDMKVRSIELSLLQRAAAHIASKFDAEAAYKSGVVAVESALEGKSGFMVAFKQQQDGSVQPFLLPFEVCADKERKMPAKFISASGNYVTPAFIKYLQPFIMGENYPPYENGKPRFANLKLKLVK